MLSLFPWLPDALAALLFIFPVSPEPAAVYCLSDASIINVIPQELFYFALAPPDPRWKMSAYVVVGVELMLDHAVNVCRTHRCLPRHISIRVYVYPYFVT